MRIREEQDPSMQLEVGRIRNILPGRLAPVHHREMWRQFFKVIFIVIFCVWMCRIQIDGIVGRIEEDDVDDREGRGTPSKCITKGTV